MKETNCDVIRDLLPLYEDNAITEETAELVREHLKDCPACREELRKMRTPLSLPPEEDGELWERYKQRRAEIRRRRNIKIGCVLSVLGLMVLSCLWYIWPRGWDALTGPVTDEVTSLSGALTELYFEIANDGEVHSGFRSWLIQWEEAEGPAEKAILQAFQRHTYRKSLRSLNPWDDNGTNTANVVLVGIIWSNENYKSFSIADNGQMFCGRDRYYTDKKLYQELSAIIQEYGTFQEAENK